MRCEKRMQVLPDLPITGRRVRENRAQRGEQVMAVCYCTENERTPQSSGTKSASYTSNL
jgi:hypothetical protein